MTGAAAEAWVEDQETACIRCGIFKCLVLLYISFPHFSLAVPFLNKNEEKMKKKRKAKLYKVMSPLNMRYDNSCPLPGLEPQ